MTMIRNARVRLRSDRGFTLIELMMAALVAAIGVGAITTILTGSRELTTDSERGTAQAHVAEREMEAALAKPYDALGMRQAPTTSTNAQDPRFHVVAVGGGFTYKWDQSAPDGAAVENVIVDAAAGDVNASTSWSDGRLSGSVYRFVTAVDDPKVANSPQRPLPDAKRVTIAVTATGGSRPRKPVVLNSVVAP